MKKIILLLLLIPLAILAVSNGVQAGSPVMVKGNDNGKNEQMPEDLKGLEKFKVEFKRNQEGEITYKDGNITLHVDDSKQFDWSSKFKVKYVYVKGGNQGNLYEYPEGETSDENLRAPDNRGGNQPDIGHVTFYYEEVEKQLFENPIIGDGADPWVVRHDGYYYYTQTTGHNITIWKSKTLTGLKDNPGKVIWTPEEGAPNSAHIWAPELHFIDGKWYVYFAASSGDMNKQRSYVLQSETSDPYSEYSPPAGTDHGKIETPDDKWAIDGTVFTFEGERYFIWSGWEGDTNVRQDIYIAPMSNPWTIEGERVLLSKPEYDWETIGDPDVNEGPQILKNEQGQVFVVYSASGSWTNDYSLGMLTLKGSDPLNTDAWEKSQEPVFKKNPEADVYGPGHNGFVQSPDGTENWILYHAAKYKDGGWDRNIRMQKFTWNEDGTPDFGTPVSTDTLLEVPSGEAPGTLTPALKPEGTIFEAEEAEVNHARIIETTSASNDYKVGGMDFEDSYVKFSGIDVPEGEYTLKVRYANGMGETSSHHVTVNGESLGSLDYESKGWENWEFASMDVDLTEGVNEIKLLKDKLFAELDYIELVPKDSNVQKYEAEHASAKNAEKVNDSDASNGQKVIGLTQKDSFIEYRIKINGKGTYTLDIAYETSESSTHNVSINGKRIGKVRYTDSAQLSTIDVKLKDGINTIRFAKGEGVAGLDYILLKKGE